MSDRVSVALKSNHFDIEPLEARILLSGDALGLAVAVHHAMQASGTPPTEIIVQSPDFSKSADSHSTDHSAPSSDAGDGLFEGLQYSSLESSVPTHKAGAHTTVTSPSPTAEQEAATQTLPSGVVRPEVATVPTASANSQPAAQPATSSATPLSGASQILGNATSQSLTASLTSANGPPASEGVSPSVSGDSLTFSGSNANDSLYLQVVSGRLLFSVTGASGSYLEVLSPVAGGQRAFSITSASTIKVDLGEGDDTLHLDASLVTALEAAGGSLQFDGGKGSDTLAGPALNIAWHVTSTNGGTLGQRVNFSSVENLSGAANNQDTFTFDGSGRLTGLVDGGLGGFDTMVINGQHQSMISTPTGPNSGTLDFNSGSDIIKYAGLEPITLSGTTTDAIVSGSTGDDQLVLEVDPSDSTKLRVRSTTGTLESVSFLKPTGSLQVNGGAGNDSITIPAGQVINLPGADVTLTAEAITLSDATLQAHNINLSAVASSVSSPNNTLLTNVSASPSAVITIGGAASITATGNLSISAGSTLNVTATARSLSVGLISTDAAVVTAIVSSTAQIHIFGTTNLNVTGTLSLTSTNSVNLLATADGSAGGATAAGVSIAFAHVTVVTSALVDGSASISAGTITVLSKSDTTVATSALSTKAGASTTTGATAQNLLDTYHPRTANGPVTVAAALAVTDLSDTTTAGLSTSGTVTSGAAVSVTCQPFTSSDAKADARGVNSSTAIGAGVALNIASSDSTATVAGKLSAPGLTIRSAVPPAPHAATDRNSFTAEAFSGAGATGVGVAGAFALNLVSDNTNHALLDAGSQAAISGDVLLDAGNRSDDKATADGIGLGNIGIGASVALDVATNGAEAAISNTAGLTGAGNRTLNSVSDHTMTTTAKAGAAGGTATAAAFGLSIPGGLTDALLGTGSALSIGSLNLTANRTSAVATNVDGKAAGPGVSVGAVFGLTVANDSSTATIGRNVTTTGALSASSTITSTADTIALAGAQGAALGSTAVNTLVGQWLTLINTNTWTPIPLTVPTAATPDGQVGVAAALAINVAGPGATTTLSSGTTLSVGAALTVQATAVYEASALADGTAVNNVTDVAAAAAVNVGKASATAAVNGAATGTSATVTSSTTGSTTSTADSGAGSPSVGVAGALAMNFAGAKSTAVVGAAGNLQSSAPSGDVMVHAVANSTNDHAFADATASGFPKTGVGASVTVNILTNTADAEVDGHLTSTRNATILSEGNYTSNAEAHGGATGGTAIGASLVLLISDNLTESLVLSTAVLTVTGDLLVRAFQQGSTHSSSIGSASGSQTAVGADFDLSIEVDEALAAVAGTASGATATV